MIFSLIFYYSAYSASPLFFFYCVVLNSVIVHQCSHCASFHGVLLALGLIISIVIIIILFVLNCIIIKISIKM